MRSKIKKKIKPETQPEGILSGGATKVWMHAGSSFGAMFYSCEFLKEYGIRFQENLSYSEDKIFSMHCMYLARTIFLTNRLMYLYRSNPTSAMRRRKFGIPYYDPIIFGYIKLDQEMTKWINDKRGILLEGRRCANRYIMEMICEHYQHLGRKKTVDLYLKKNTDILDVVNGDGKYYMLQQNPEYKYYTENTKKYILKMYIKGFVFHLIRNIRRVILKCFG